ncbi:respiratory nitrate reductase subunit gamma [Edwardsiella tarda]|uniref:Respiratory nitrate reductase subunit gamma n=1 Tax=Edwardsiella tarda ATCC 15947 = NBRC 105688 TaxID=667121 RepID=A0AC61TGZ7_EDWTA|nr:respiratory nitrate reductase subunit gamma [Edwardsiella tarda]AKH90285.1 respiratory nitrate reductase subunit gamma [Edwardsiella tarda]UAL56973.1 respiratory nitrate reductase subunit gamma [Edwardsiella tarda]UCP99972.1 respiratory nitrate reductase subunit gamma [Edwardsiella tarda ATCC 15947 = NBRC 105688]WKS80971.1 respiratory nitrate reductase subunit gamma [Edwardsiella tarda]SPW31128.1 Respiratory nitrate reductase 1 gamma chain [Edwardsiella tarda]
MSALSYFLFNIYPYIAITVLVLGCLYRFDYGQYTWKSGSSLLMANGRYSRYALNLFHVGMLGVFFGHVVGLLTPRSWYQAYISDQTHQILELIAGSFFGTLLLIGAFMLLARRLFNPRVAATSSFSDKLILTLLVIQICLGMLTIPIDLLHPSGTTLQSLISWSQGIVTFRPDPARYLQGVDWLFKVHMVLGLTIFLIFPFTRLVHICSLPIGYVLRRRQVVKTLR